MRTHFFFLFGLASFVFVACEDSGGGGSSSSSSSSSSASSNSSSSGDVGAGGMSGTGGQNAGGAAGMGTGGAGGGQPKDALCGSSANGAMCAQGLVCCYPCGIPGCDFKCTTPCDPNSPGCANGCLLLP